MERAYMKKVGEGWDVKQPMQQLEKFIQPLTMRDALYEMFAKDWDLLRRIRDAKDGEIFEIQIPLQIEISSEVAKIAAAEFLVKKLPPA